MKALLQKSCKECTVSSINTYYYNIKALAKIADQTRDYTDNRAIPGNAPIEAIADAALFLASDDNYNDSQRTLLFSFVLEPRQ